MIAIDMEMPNYCFEISPNPFDPEEGRYYLCPLYSRCGYREEIKTNFKPADCPIKEVIICKDCKYCKKDIKEGIEHLWCEKESCVTSEDCYCGNGERKE